MKKIFLVITFIVLVGSVNSQVLDVPARNDDQYIHSNWCWAKMCTNIIVYYGNTIEMCEVVEYARTRNPDRFGYQDCCLIPRPTNCYKGNFYEVAGGMIDILNNWSVRSTRLHRAMTENEIQENLSNSRPFAVGISGHVMTGFGYMHGHVHIHDGGNGSIIINYNELVTNGPYNNDKPWVTTLRMDVSAEACPQTQHISGTLRGHRSVYKALRTITANCVIRNYYDQGSLITFSAGNTVTLDPEFEVKEGSSLDIYAGNTQNCP